MHGFLLNFLNYLLSISMTIKGSYKGNRFSYCHFFSSNLYDQINDHQKIT